MAEQTYFMLYFDYREHLDLLTDEERGRLLTALFEYAEHGTVPELSGASKMAFSFIRSQIDRDFARYQERCERNRENGKRGGKPKQTERLESEPVGSDGNPTEANQAKTKKKTKKKENTNTSNIPLTPLDGCSQSLRDAVRDWLTYKHERSEDYKPTGLQSLLTQIQNKAAAFGDAAVCGAIRLSMSNNWRGIVWDRLEKQARPKQGAPPNMDAALTDFDREWMERVKRRKAAGDA